MKARLVIILPAIWLLLFGLSFSGVLGQDYSGVLAMFPLIRALPKFAWGMVMFSFPIWVISSGALADGRGLKFSLFLVAWLAAAVLLATFQNEWTFAGNPYEPTPSWRLFVSAFYCATLLFGVWAMVASLRSEARLRTKRHSQRRG